VKVIDLPCMCSFEARVILGYPVTVVSSIIIVLQMVVI